MPSLRFRWSVPTGGNRRRDGGVQRGRAVVEHEDHRVVERGAHVCVPREQQAAALGPRDRVRPAARRAQRRRALARVGAQLGLLRDERGAERAPVARRCRVAPTRLARGAVS